jgi:hypothetical protein
MTDRPFSECSSEHVFEELTKQLVSEETRSLWSRMHAELRRKGVPAVGTYLDSEFTQMLQDFEAELARVAPQPE